ncbi:MAG TPA: O-antigen ligase family protein [Gemmatimonadaceae bacterium]|nr:O-antigen ligase family protein [Gemmatimonadaceae bacterium]
MTQHASSTLTLAARGALFLTLGVPLFLAPGFLFPFVSVRGLLFRGLVAIAGVCLLLRALVAENAERGRRDWVLVGLAVLLVVSIASSAFGYSWERSVFGTLARLGGVWTLANLIAFYILLRIAFEPRHWLWYVRGVVFVGLLATAYGLLQRFQVALGIVWEGSPHPPNGPLGNYGIFAGYLLFPIAAACYLAVSEAQGKWRRVMAAAVVPLVGMLWLTTNRSSVLGLAAGVVISSALYARYSGKRRLVWIVAAVVGLAAAAVGAMRPGRPLEAIGPRMPATIQRFIDVAPTSTGADRRLQWRAASLAALDRPLLGYGPENHEIVWTKHFDPTIYTLAEDQLWDRTHNAYFEAVGTTGFLGLAALLFLWVTILGTIDSRRREHSIASADAAVLMGMNTAYAVYLWFWFYDLTAMALWIAVAAYVSSVARPPLVTLVGSRAWRRQSIAIAAGTVAVGATLIWTHSIAPLLESRRLGVLQARADGRAPAIPAETLRDFRAQLVSTSPYGAPGITLFSRYLSLLRPAFPTLQQDTGFARELAAALQQSLVAIERARAADPMNDRLMTVKTRIMIRASQYYGSPGIAVRAEATAREAVALAPRRVGPRLVLAGLLAAAKRHEEALAQADSALMVHPRSADAHGVRASIFLNWDRPDSAASELHAAMAPAEASARASGVPQVRTDPGLVLAVAVALAEKENARRAAELLRFYMRRWYGDYSSWRSGTSRSLNTIRLDRTIASVLPVLELKAGSPDSSLAAAQAFVSICHPAEAKVADFVASIGMQNQPNARYPLSVASASGDPGVIVADVTRLCESRTRR